MRDKVTVMAAKTDVDLTGIEKDALHILLQLQYKRPEAEGMIRQALERNPKI